MFSPHVKRGFTFIELLVTLAVLAIIATFSVYAFRTVYRDSGERIATLEVVDALREARNNSLSAKFDTTYGVHIATSSVTRFIGNVYVSGHASNTVYIFEAGATATGTVVNNSTDIIFARLTGIPSVTGTIFISNGDGTSTTTITIGGTGLVEY